MKITIKIYILAILISSNYLISEERKNDSDASLEQVVCNIPGVKTKRNEEGFLDRLNSNIRREGCIKGDILLIRDMKVTARYLRVAAHACDLKRPFAVPSDNSVFICHYQGFVRQQRNPNYN